MKKSSQSNTGFKSTCCKDIVSHLYSLLHSTHFSPKREITIRFLCKISLLNVYYNSHLIFFFRIYGIKPAPCLRTDKRDYLTRQERQRRCSNSWQILVLVILPSWFFQLLCKLHILGSKSYDLMNIRIGSDIRQFDLLYLITKIPLKNRQMNNFLNSWYNCNKLVTIHTYYRLKDYKRKYTWTFERTYRPTIIVL